MNSALKTKSREAGPKEPGPKELTVAQKGVLATVLKEGEAIFGPAQTRPVQALEKAGLVTVKWWVQGNVMPGRYHTMATVTPAAFGTTTQADRASGSWGSLVFLAKEAGHQPLAGESDFAFLARLVTSRP